ncbi:hypothetical protein [Chelatococcus reniformis]|uniref:Uncharacterized protein n=1 Tax=Chelatococcus reniformis TaxID=1494448 RepID=A0A916U8T8_9HYPH|nr:hypothetical protein [Chelatococcus reniformis]GGC64009.1 hypothetical protein GCM10010994_23300 [Chelatococcus reniformis]
MSWLDFVARTVLGGIALLGCLLLAGFGYVAVVTYVESRTRYDRHNSDYRYVTQQLKPSADGGWAAGAIDLHRINGGNWQILCVIGAYESPETLGAEAARRQIALVSMERIAIGTFAASEIDEGEGAIAFVDGQGRGRVVLIDGFERLIPQNGTRCFSQDTREVTLPIPRDP